MLVLSSWNCRRLYPAPPSFVLQIAAIGIWCGRERPRSCRSGTNEGEVVRAPARAMSARAYILKIQELTSSAPFGPVILARN